MQANFGVVMRDDQKYLLEARLGRVARQFEFATIDEYVDASCEGSLHSEHAQALVDAMTTHETSFFRDAAFWQKLETELLPRFDARAEPLRVWSAACSTGQELYSLAMILRESFPNLWERAELIGTDVSQETVARARAGEYAVLEVQRGLTSERKRRFMVPTALGMRVDDSLRSKVQFTVHNLVDERDKPPAPCDLVLCRNVLIYFSDADRRTVVQKLKKAGREGTFYGVGTAEQLPARSIGGCWYEGTNWRD
jgi:chemotaxis protein methyltransferase CheR